jgi:hypothetical protein
MESRPHVICFNRISIGLPAFDDVGPGTFAFCSIWLRTGFTAGCTAVTLGVGVAAAAGLRAPVPSGRINRFRVEGFCAVADVTDVGLLVVAALARATAENVG